MVRTGVTDKEADLSAQPDGPTKVVMQSSGKPPPLSYPIAHSKVKVNCHYCRIRPDAVVNRCKPNTRLAVKLWLKYQRSHITLSEYSDHTTCRHHLKITPGLMRL